MPRSSDRASTACVASAGRVAERTTADKGFSLVELMVALAIASVLLGALTVMFVNTSNARAELDRSSRQIEGGRYAMQVLSDEIRHAGYYGALAQAPTLGGSVTSLPDPCAYDVPTVQASFALPLQGYAGASTAAGLDTGKLGCLTAKAGYKPNTAVLVVRRANTSAGSSAVTSGYFNIQTSGCAGDLSRYVLDSYSNSGSFTLHSNASPGCIPITTAPAASIEPFYIRIYYVSTCSGVDCTASGANNVPTLKRIDVTPDGPTFTPTPIVDGIENIQFDYGIDTSSPVDGSPDVYTNTTAHAATMPSSLAEWQNVMAVRVYVLSRNLDASSGFTDTKTYALGPATVSSPGDSYRRHVYSELVRLNNPAGRRE
jgi:type IV pilus assembly protein PilW